jgi:hypothetical protein
LQELENQPMEQIWAGRLQFPEIRSE